MTVRVESITSGCAHTCPLTALANRRTNLGTAAGPIAVSLLSQPVRMLFSWTVASSALAVPAGLPGTDPMTAGSTASVSPSSAATDTAARAPRRPPEGLPVRSREAILRWRKDMSLTLRACVIERPGWHLARAITPESERARGGYRTVT
jgi:hypothetical protein